jgi:uncharacterized protein (TIGR02145 family)
MIKINIWLLLSVLIITVSSCCEITGDCNPIEPEPEPITKEISVSGNLDFDIVYVGQESTKSFKIKNIGTGDLIVSSITMPNGYTLNWTDGTMVPNDEVIVEIIFVPQSETMYNGTIQVNSDAVAGISSISVTGEGENALLFTDTRDGQVYRYEEIGNVFWMAENLNYQSTNSVCYDNTNSYCNQYGRLYGHQEVMQSANISNNVPSGVQGICPNGWHLPSKNEWQLLIDEYDDGNSANSFEEVYNALIQNGNSGFEVLLGGYAIWGNVFQDEGVRTQFWSASGGTWDVPDIFLLGSSTQSVTFSDAVSSELLYCRCVQN